MKTLLNIVFFFCVNILLSQDPYHIHLSKKDGLPSNSIYSIHQDKKGFIWFANNAGLTRYDGFEYKTFTSTEQTSKAGSCITEDKYGRIWYENFDGFIYYVEKDSLKVFQQNTPIGYIPFGISDKFLFVFQGKGIDVYDIQTLTFIKTILIRFNSAEHATVINGKFYVIIEDNIYCLTEDLSLISSGFYKNKTILSKQIYQASNYLYVLNKHNSNKQIHVFDQNLNIDKIIPIREPSFIQGSSFIDSLIWIHTTNGTYAYSIHSSSSLVEYSFLKNKSISCLIKDRQGNYWYGTTNEGIYIVPSLRNSVTYIENVLPNRIIEVNNNYCIGSKTGELVLCDKNFNVIRVFKNLNDNSEVNFLSYDPAFNKFLYTSNGFTELNYQNQTTTKIHHISVKDIVRVDSNYFAFAASGYCGLAQLNQITNKSKWDTIFVSNRNIYDKNTCSFIQNVRGKSVIYLAGKNTLYFATNVGLYKITPHEKREIKQNNKSFYAVKMIEYKSKIYALDTKGGLFLIENDSITDFLNNKLAIDKTDIKYVKGKNNKLVIVTQDYAYLANLDNYSVNKIDIDARSYEIGDVLINQNSFVFVTNNGIITTTLAKKTTLNNSAFVVNEFRVNGIIQNTNIINEFDYQQNDVIIKYSVLDFSNNHTNYLYYRINESDWKLASPETRVIEFAALSSGNYVIEFKLNETVSPEKIIFTISTPFWKTIWFNILLSALVLIIAFVYYKWQLTKLRNKNKLLQDKINLEHDLNKTVLKSIKAQMNPHFFYNALNTIQAFIFTNDKTKASSYLAKFSKLTRAILEMSEKETISLSEEIDALKLYLELEKMRFKDGFSYQLNITNIENADLIEFPPMIIQPYVENAIKHGLLHLDGNRELSVSFNLSADSLLVVIDDNGIGRKRSAELNKIKNHKYQSFSSEANEKRLEILNKGRNNTIAVEIIDKTNDLGVATGTRVKLTIPIK